MFLGFRFELNLSNFTRAGFIMSDGGFSSNNVIHENDYVIVERVYEDKTRIAKVVKDG